MKRQGEGTVGKLCGEGTHEGVRTRNGFAFLCEGKNDIKLSNALQGF